MVKEEKLAISKIYIINDSKGNEFKIRVLKEIFPEDKSSTYTVFVGMSDAIKDDHFISIYCGSSPADLPRKNKYYTLEYKCKFNEFDISIFDGSKIVVASTELPYDVFEFEFSEPITYDGHIY